MFSFKINCGGSEMNISEMNISEMIMNIPKISDYCMIISNNNNKTM